MRVLNLAVFVVSLSLSAGVACGQTTAPASGPASAMNPAIDAEHLALARKLIDGGLAWLLANREAEGGWSIGGSARPAATAMALKALVQQEGYDSSHPVVRQGLAVLLSYQHADGPARGGIFDAREGQANYTTALAVMALSAMDDPQLNAARQAAVEYLRGIQIVPGSQSPDVSPVGQGHPFIGGVGYGQHGRPDLSNLGMWMEALHEAGVAGDDPAMQRAVAFLNRTQNRSESNPMAWAAEGAGDGGFVYAPAVRDLSSGESKAGSESGGAGLRSYGSMTYTGFKSLLYANVSRGDARVQAARQWIGRHWTLRTNPNMPHEQSKEGLFYYYHVFAKALRAWGEPEIADAAGQAHNWRHELIDVLAEQARSDGSWVNSADRWYEANPLLATCYSVLALQETVKP